MSRRNWSREEIIIALYLYYIIPFQKVSSRNPVIEEYAKFLNRSAAALGMKIGNLGRFDNTLKKQNISGLSNGSKLDELVWEEFFEKWDLLADTSFRILESLRKSLDHEALNGESDLIFKSLEGKEAIRQTKVRINQAFFRASVLASYNNCCCITGINMPELLVASHIKPWSIDKENRVNPQNGLCLNSLHDKAFDRGLITISDDFCIILSTKLKNASGMDLYFKSFEKQKIMLPVRFSPDREFLEFHRDAIFLG